MKKSINTTFTVLALSLLALNCTSSFAQDNGDSPKAGFKVLNAEELQKLHGTSPVQIRAVRTRATFRYDLTPDGIAHGHNESLVASAAAAAGTSAGKWSIKEDQQRVCFEWSHPRWQNGCMKVIQFEDGSYAWSSDGKDLGNKFTITPK